MHHKFLFVSAAALSWLFTTACPVIAQGTTAFVYQGQLHDTGTNANGTYTMIFNLYDAVTNGNQVGSVITNNPALINGLFTANLDFGAAFDGTARWLEITVASDILSPRVQVLASPYALYSTTSGNAGSSAYATEAGHAGTAATA